MVFIFCKYFSHVQEKKVVCLESDEEEPVVSESTFDKLLCHITSATNFLTDGVKIVLFGSITFYIDKLVSDRNSRKTF